MVIRLYPNSGLVIAFLRPKPPRLKNDRSRTYIITGNKLVLDVLFTIDVEIWCDGWNNIDEKFPNSFRKYIYGETQKGEFGLPFQLNMLKNSGLTSVCFVEPLFSTRFGQEPLQEIVDIIMESGHEIQLHLHTEWVDESLEPIITDCNRKRQYLRDFSAEEQIQLLSAGVNLLTKAGASRPTAFRAGGFGFNRDSLLACAANNIQFDSSYNASCFGLESGVEKGTVIVEPLKRDGVYEYPLTVFDDGRGILRHTQLTACSFKEMERALWQALEQERKAFTILSHGFELLDMRRNRPDKQVITRFEQLCNFFERNRDAFRVVGFNDLDPVSVEGQPQPLQSSRWLTYQRMIQQVSKRLRI
jgi:hypothetical protein